MPAIPLAIALSIAVHAAPQVSPDTLVTFAQAESSLDPLRLHDNTTGRSYAPETKAEAIALASRLISVGHSVDAGILQVNSANFRLTGLSVADAFDTWHSMHAGAYILTEAWRSCPSNQSDAARLRCAASIYNTGSPTRGASYVAGIVRVAAHVVPSVKELLLAGFPTAAQEGATSRQVTTTGATSNPQQAPGLADQLVSFSKARDLSYTKE